MAFNKPSWREGAAILRVSSQARRAASTLPWSTIERLRAELKQIPQGTLAPHRHPSITDLFGKHIRVYTHPASGKAIPSVTTVLQATQYNKHLQQWRQREVDEHGEDGFQANRRATLDLGHSVHKYIEDFLKSKREMTTSNLITEHVKSVQPFLQYVDPRLSLLEASVWDNEGLVTGRFDALCWIQDRFYLVDFKTSKRRKLPSSHSNSYAQQGAAYRKALLDAVSRLELSELQRHGINDDELGMLVVTIYGHCEGDNGVDAVRPCDVATITPESCQVFFQDYSRRFALMHTKYPELNDGSVDASVNLLKTGSWQHHMMGDQDAASVEYLGHELKPLPSKPVRIPPRILKALLETEGEDEVYEEVPAEVEHLWPFKR
eukprot:m.76973 g.76973  ORF g.76973 m.76973 type:complete len:377 (+) comp14447_c0_seq2:1675-2805(+)